jgi:hypothetical protein
MRSNKMKKKLMKSKLDSIPEERMPHIFVPSYNRPEFVTAIMLKDFSPAVLEKIHIVVRPEQAKAYRKANPNLNILPITPSYKINGLASTRQFIFEYAAERHYPIIIDMDDDIKNLAYMYDGESGTGNPCSKHTIKIDREKDPLIQQKVLLMAAEIAREVFREHPNAMLGNIRRQRLSQGEDNAKLKYIINSGPTPRQVTLMNVKALSRKHINRDMIFDRHGDDIGFCAAILKAGGDLFNIPCLTYDYVSEKCDSVIRTPETEKELHKYEWDMLQKYPIRDYLRTSFRDADGDYMWGDVNFTALHKLRGTQRIKEYWED